VLLPLAVAASGGCSLWRVLPLAVAAWECMPVSVSCIAAPYRLGVRPCVRRRHPRPGSRAAGCWWALSPMPRCRRRCVPRLGVFLGGRHRVCVDACLRVLVRCIHICDMICV
jgi:hypothetical protein